MKKRQYSSTLRQELTKYDFDPGYFCKNIRDQFIRNFIKNNNLSNIVDIGCDTCHIAGLLNYDKYTFSYIGVDKENHVNLKNICNNNQSFLIINKFEKEIDFLKRTVKSFDVILLLDVIEHFENKRQDKLFLKTIIDNMIINQYLIISTPNKINKINWPKYHNYEYNIKEILNICSSLKEIKLFGWSYNDGPEDPNEIIDLKIYKVLYAINNPHTSRDFCVVFKKDK